MRVLRVSRGYTSKSTVKAAIAPARRMSVFVLPDMEARGEWLDWFHDGDLVLQLWQCGGLRENCRRHFSCAARLFSRAQFEFEVTEETRQ